MRAFYAALIVSTCLQAALARADDVLTQAVSFALTGTDGSKIVVADRAHCIFKIGDDTYYLNNIHVDRIRVRSWKNKLGNEWSTVELHGKDKILERFAPAPVFTGSDLDNAMMRQDPNYFARKGQTTASTDETIRVSSNESDRIMKAWQYIYAHGCKGQVSPF